ncbi:MAG: sigma-54-dependent transcriptional regulator [Candidatus Anammoxibacter sp.]
MGKILVIDDDDVMRLILTDSLKKKGYQVESASCAEDGIEKTGKTPFDLIITDVRLPKMSGIDAIKPLLEKSPNSIVVVVTAFGKNEIALKSIKEGAYDYLTKPFNMDELQIIVKRALEKKRLEDEIQALRLKAEKSKGFDEIIGKSESLNNLLTLINKLSSSDSTVLITGESGTGKELVADAIQKKSKRSKGPFIKVNCVAIPETLIESELFGHEKGAFTGAHAARIGKFELAHGGTIFLDEIGEMSISAQSKLLRVLEQREIEKIGRSKPLKVDTRVIAATNLDIKQRVKEKKFREDLFFRLNTFCVDVPPLRERHGDIPLLVDHLIEKMNEKMGKKIKGVSKDVMDRFLDYSWPGNVRELKNVIERAVTMVEGQLITTKVIEPFIKGTKTEKPLSTEEPITLSERMNKIEKETILSVLKEAGWRQIDAAAMLGISKKNLWNKLQKHNIDVNKYIGK